MSYKSLAERNTKNFCNGKTLRQISEESGVPLTTIQHRWMRGLRTYDELTNNENLHGAEFRMECATAKGRRLLKSIEASGMNLTDVSKRTGISRSVIWNFCHNDTDMSSNRLFAICTVVNCSMDYVMGVR